MTEFIQPIIGIVVISILFLLPFLFMFWLKTLKRNELQVYLANELGMIYLPGARHPRFEHKGYVEGKYHGHILKFQAYNIGSGVDYWGDPVPVSNVSHFLIEVKTLAPGKLELQSLGLAGKKIVDFVSESGKVDYFGLSNNFLIVNEPKGFGLGVLSDPDLLRFFSNQLVQILRVEVVENELYLYLQRTFSDDQTWQSENFLPIFDFLVFVAAKHSNTPVQEMLFD